MLASPYLSRCDGEQVVAPGKYAGLRHNLGIRVGFQRLQANV